MGQSSCGCSPTFSSACLADTVGTPITRSAGAERPRVYVPSFSSSMPGCSTDSSRWSTLPSPAQCLGCTCCCVSKSHIKRQTDCNRLSLSDCLCSEATYNLQLHVCKLTITEIGMRANPGSPVGTSTRVSCVMRRAARALEVAAAQPGTTSVTPLDPAINALQIGSMLQ